MALVTFTPGTAISAADLNNNFEDESYSYNGQFVLPIQVYNLDVNNLNAASAPEKEIYFTPPAPMRLGEWVVQAEHSSTPSAFTVGLECVTEPRALGGSALTQIVTPSSASYSLKTLFDFGGEDLVVLLPGFVYRLYFASTSICDNVKLSFQFLGQRAQS